MKMFIRHYPKLAPWPFSTNQKCSQKSQYWEVQLSIMTGGEIKRFDKELSAWKNSKTQEATSAAEELGEYSDKTLWTQETREKSQCCVSIL